MLSIIKSFFGVFGTARDHLHLKDLVDSTTFELVERYFGNNRNTKNTYTKLKRSNS